MGVDASLSVSKFYVLQLGDKGIPKHTTKRLTKIKKLDILQKVWWKPAQTDMRKTRPAKTQTAHVNIDRSVELKLARTLHSMKACIANCIEPSLLNSSTCVPHTCFPAIQHVRSTFVLMHYLTEKAFRADGISAVIFYRSHQHCKG